MSLMERLTAHRRTGTTSVRPRDLQNVELLQQKSPEHPYPVPPTFLGNETIRLEIPAQVEYFETADDALATTAP